MNSKPSIWSVLGPYKWWIVGILAFTIAQSALGLAVPKLVADAIDAYATGSFDVVRIVISFAIVAVGMFIFTTIQNMLQVAASERVARDMREQIAGAVSRQSLQFVQAQTGAKLLTNLTSDVDGIKGFVANGVSSIVWALFMIVGASVLLFITDWRLALAVMAVIPLVGVVFAVVFGKVGGLFKKSQEVIDTLNRVISESILGAALIRVVNSQHDEYQKFLTVNDRAKSVGISILKLFASMIPVIMAVSNAGLVIVLLLGGHFVITNTMTIGELSAFNGYISLLIFPLIMIGFLGDMIGRATASFNRITDVLGAPIEKQGGDVAVEITGTIAVQNLNISFDEKQALRDVSFSIQPRSKTAIIGPTAAGKTQLLYAMTGLTRPTSGGVIYEGVSLEDLDRKSLHRQMGLVFQDSVMFNVSVRENILFGANANDDELNKAVLASELVGVISELPNGIDSVISERGTSLSGGQKQRIMLARALAMNPKVLFLDDFTARVDIATEEKIIQNLEKYYPDLTIISVTQKISSAKKFDQIILLMEGEVLGTGTHDELMHTSPEYAQIYQSQQSTHIYEVHA